MPKSYTLEYLYTMQHQLEDELAMVQKLIKETAVKAKAQGDGPSAAKSTIKKSFADMDQRLLVFRTDVKQMKYADFREKYIDRL